MNRILMNKPRCVSTVFIIFLLLITLIILVLFSVNYLNHNRKKEPFTTRLRESYRPFFRRVRLNMENTHNSIKKRINLFFRKFGII